MEKNAPLVRIGTRGSPLALTQAHMVRGLLGAAHPELAAPEAVSIHVIQTTGDRLTDRTLAAIGGKGLFTKEIEEALLADQIDIAVHCMKDVATWLPDDLVIDCILEREDPRDAFFSNIAGNFHELPHGATVGTASLRRQALVRRLRPDLKVVPLRGNVDTRLRKLAEGVVDATFLAYAGLKRLDQTERITSILEPEIMLPAVAQGTLGIERRRKDARIAAYLAALHHPETALVTVAERALLTALDGSCRTPIAGLALLEGADGIVLRGLVIRPDGSEVHELTMHAAAAEADRLGREMGEILKRQAGPSFFDLPAPDAPAV